MNLFFKCLEISAYIFSWIACKQKFPKTMDASCPYLRSRKNRINKNGRNDW